MLINTIKKALRQGSVGLTRHRVDLISRLVCALIHVRSVKMKKLACSLSGRAKMDSQYRRLQRFFSSELSPFGVYSVDRLQVSSPWPAPSVGHGSYPLAVGSHRSECVVYRFSPPRRVYSLGISVVAKAGQLPYRGTKTHPDPGPGLPQSQRMLLSRRSRVHRSSVVCFSASATGRFCHSPTRQYVDHARRWSAALFGGLQSAYAPRHHPILSPDHPLWRIDPESSVSPPRPRRTNPAFNQPNRPYAGAGCLWPALDYRDDVCLFEIERI